jgi:hypothetical protein
VRVNRHSYLCSARLYARRGSDLPHAKLTDEAVRAIRAEHRPYSRTHGAPALARKYNLHRRTIEKVLSYASWVHVR